jgi:predicted negative regulator of RcsB-dependent stress response
MGNTYVCMAVACAVLAVALLCGWKFWRSSRQDPWNGEE